MTDFKDFIAGIGEINVIVYLIYVCTGLAPLYLYDTPVSEGHVNLYLINRRRSFF